MRIYAAPSTPTSTRSLPSRPGRRPGSASPSCAPTVRSDLGRPLDARISARMTHVFALAQMRGIEGRVPPGLPRPRRPDRSAARRQRLLVRRGRPHLRDQRDPRAPRRPLPARPVRDDRRCRRRPHGRAHRGRAHPPRGPRRETRTSAGGTPPTVPCAKKSTRPPGKRSPLRRLSTNLDTAQAYLAAWEATGKRVWFDRARSILRLVGEIAARCGFALPDLYDEEWRPLPPPADQAPARTHPARRHPARPRLQGRAPHRAGPRDPHPHGRKPRAAGCSTPRPRSTTAPSPTAGPTRASAASSTPSTPPASSPPPNACTGSCARPPAPPASSPNWSTLDRAEDLAVDYARAVAWADSHARAGVGRWIHEIAPDGSVSMRVWEGRPDALTAARMLARGAAPIDLTVTGATARAGPPRGPPPQRRLTPRAVHRPRTCGVSRGASCP